MELKSGNKTALMGPDNSGPTMPYRFTPVYTMCHVGIDELFRPTGGQLLFKLVKPSLSISRNIMTKEYKDIITLKELDNILTESNPKNKAVEMYRPMLVTEGDNRVSLIKLANHIMPFGVTSIYQCKDWHKDFMTTVQPVLINGKCHVDKTDYAKQDTLRIPTDMCSIHRGGGGGNPKQFVYMTFSKAPGGKDWRPKFVVTPQSSYVNTTMMESEGYSISYPLGIIDFLDEGHDNTSVYMFRPASVEEPVWMLEGFVFKTLSEWQLVYPNGPFKFYENLGNDLICHFLRIDPARRSIVPAVMKLMNNNNNDDDDATTKRGCDKKRKRESSPRQPRFYGKGTPTTTSPTGLVKKESQHKKFITIDGEYHRMRPQDRLDIGKNRGNNLLTFSLNNAAPIRTVSKDLMSKIMRPFATQVSGDIMKRINAYVEREMQNGSSRRSIQIPRLGEGEYATVSAKDIYLILSMAFLGRLKISGRDAATAMEQMNMTNLFKGQTAKLTCLINYFVKGLVEANRFFQRRRNITFFHKGLDHIDDMQYIRRPLLIIPEGPAGIEDIEGAIFADFANRRFGGGVFGRGAVQEEILLITHPEALLGRALFEPMTQTTACVIMGAVRVSEYRGYGGGSSATGSAAFQYAGSTPFDDTQPLDGENRALTEIVAFDAINYVQALKSQYNEMDVMREYTKAATAFGYNNITNLYVPVATGLWGSGDYAGDPVLKLLLQVAAASAAGRPLILVRIGDYMAKIIDEIVTLAEQLNLQVRDFITHIVTAIKAQRYSNSDRADNSKTTAFVILNHLQRVRDSPPTITSGIGTPSLFLGSNTIDSFGLAAAAEEAALAEEEEETDKSMDLINSSPPSLPPPQVPEDDVETMYPPPHPPIRTDSMADMLIEEEGETTTTTTTTKRNNKRQKSNKN